MESHQLRMYIESNYTADRVVFVNDKEKSCGINGNLIFPGYNLVRHDTGIFTVEADSNNGDPELPGSAINSEFVTALRSTEVVGGYISNVSLLFLVLLHGYSSRSLLILTTMWIPFL